MSVPDLDRLFRPGSVALVGAIQRTGIVVPAIGPAFGMPPPRSPGRHAS